MADYNVFFYDKESHNFQSPDLDIASDIYSVIQEDLEELRNELSDGDSDLDLDLDSVSDNSYAFFMTMLFRYKFLNMLSTEFCLQIIKDHAKDFERLYDHLMKDDCEDEEHCTVLDETLCKCDLCNHALSLFVALDNVYVYTKEESEDGLDHIPQSVEDFLIKFGK